MTAWPANPFWDFSLRLYARPGVAPACLHLQARHNVDVNIVLYCAWLGVERGIGADERALAAVLAHVSAWHDAVVRRLRAVRVDLKAETYGAPREFSEGLRADIKRGELDAERIEQHMLLTFALSDAPCATPSPVVARDNIYAYLKTLGIQPDSEDDAAIGTLVTGMTV